MSGIVYHRSRLLQTMRGTGVMMAIGVSIERAQSICTETCKKYNDNASVVVAAINGPTRYLLYFFLLFPSASLSSLTATYCDPGG